MSDGLEIISNVTGCCSNCEMELKEYSLKEAMKILSEKGSKKPKSVFMVQI